MCEYFNVKSNDMTVRYDREGVDLANRTFWTMRALGYVVYSCWSDENYNYTRYIRNI